MTEREQFEAYFASRWPNGTTDHFKADHLLTWQAARAAPAKLDPLERVVVERGPAPAQPRSVSELCGDQTIPFADRAAIAYANLSADDEAPAQPAGERILLGRIGSAFEWTEVDEQRNDGLEYAWATIERIK
jgi:hypothetical protein